MVHFRLTGNTKRNVKRTTSDLKKLHGKINLNEIDIT